MRAVAVCLGLILVGSSIAYVRYILKAESDHLLPKEGLVISGFEGRLPITEEKFLPELDKAKAEVKRRYESANSCRFWGRIAGWVGLLLTSAMTVAAGLYGGRVGPDGNAAATLDQVLKEQQRSKGLMRVLGVLVAASTLPALFAQRLESDATQFASSGRELNKVLLTATEKLYDPSTPLKEAQRVLNELADAVESR